MLILASASPRRKEILQDMGIDFRTVPSEYREDNERQADPAALVMMQAEGKAREVWDRTEGKCPVLGADTLVVLDGSVLGKPHDREEAVHMLQSLSGKTHEVLTGIALATRQGMEKTVCTTEVTFRELTDQEILDYVASGEPMDKAGAYGIQGGGRNFAAAVGGEISNVIGLPRREVLHMLEKAGCLPSCRS